VLRASIAILALCAAQPLAAQESEMLIIAHRGASGERPEHTLAAYERAIDQGADYIEPDLVATSDGVLVARHENEISGTTDVADRPEFADRRTTRTIDGYKVNGWFTEDFTLSELQTLRARERLPEIRPANTAFDGLYQVPTLAEIISLVKAKEAESGRRIGLYPEIKHPTYFMGIGHDLADMLVEQLHAAGYQGEDAPVFIQSFEVAPLVRLNDVTDLRLVQLVSSYGGPADILEQSYREMLDAQGLITIAAYADGIGADLGLLFNDDGRTTGLTEAAHHVGLLVHAWTLRKENAFLPERFRSSDDQLDLAGCYPSLWDEIVSSGVDGVFTDDPLLAVESRNAGPEAIVSCHR